MDGEVDGRGGGAVGGAFGQGRGGGGGVVQRVDDDLQWCISTRVCEPVLADSNLLS